MWMVNPKLMCNQHLLGEHVELHMLVGAMLKKKSLTGYAAKGLIELSRLYGRHRVLTHEMEARGMKHKSGLPVLPDDVVTHYGDIWLHTVDRQRSLNELHTRCERCRNMKR